MLKIYTCNNPCNLHGKLLALSLIGVQHGHDALLEAGRGGYYHLGAPGGAAAGCGGGSSRGHGVVVGGGASRQVERGYIWRDVLLILLIFK